jgi:mannose-1-phosphate guanylyltransferase
MNQHHYAVIMAGGIGSRFWPMSRQARPKQFLDVMDAGRTLIQATYDRMREIVPESNIYVVTNHGYVEQVQEQLPRLSAAQVLAEPVGRNTAPCIAYAVCKIGAMDPKAQIVVSPADHLIRDVALFRQDILLGLNAAAQHPHLFTLGILPSRPDTGYGYIQFIEEEGSAGDYHLVKTFTEKPDLEMARVFLRSGDFLWNSGIFIFAVGTMRDALQEFLPDMFELFEVATPELNSLQEAEAIRRVYSAVKPISIDYGVMEKARNVYVIPSSFDWSDLGTWNSLYEQMDKDYLGNAVTGNVMVFDANNNIVKNFSDKLLVLKGVEDMIVVETDDVVLICPRSMEQSVKEIVGEIKQTRGEQFL